MGNEAVTLKVTLGANVTEVTTHEGLERFLFLDDVPHGLSGYDCPKYLRP